SADTRASLFTSEARVFRPAPRRTAVRYLRERLLVLRAAPPPVPGLSQDRRSDHADGHRPAHAPIASIAPASGRRDPFREENTEGGWEMQTAETLARRGGLFQLLDESAQPRLLRFCDDEEVHTDTLRSAPAHRGILNF